jgi:hypothetical protein
VRYNEVKVRAGVGDVELLQNERLKAQQLGDGDGYWLVVASNALAAPDLQAIQNPAQRLRRNEVVERVRCCMRQAGWQWVRWIHPPPPGQFVADLQALGEILILGP